MIFGYARVSTKEQNLEMQIDALKKFGVDEVHQETESGNNTNRPKLNEILLKLRKGDTLVIWKLDRLGRTVNQLVTLAEEFNNKGIQLVSLTEDLNTTTPTGRFCFYIWSAMAQMERDIIAERTREGLKAARARGRIGGRKKTDKKAIDKALRMYQTKEFSIQEILDTTGISKTTLYNYIRHTLK